MYMNPYPFSLSSFWSQFLIAMISIYVFLTLIMYLVLSIRSKHFVAVPARLVGNGRGSKGRKSVYKYLVGGQEYSCPCGSSLLSLSGAWILFRKKISARIKCPKETVIYCDPLIPSISCHSKDVSLSVLIILSLLSGFFFALLIYL